MSPILPDQRERFRCRACGLDGFHRSIGNGPIDHKDNRSRQYKVVKCESCANVTLCLIHRIFPTSGGGDGFIDGVEYCPPLVFRTKPDWHDSLATEYATVLNEVYAALDHGLFILACTGVRTALDRLLVKIVGDHGGFDVKVGKLVEQRVITDSQKELLLTVIDAGSASAHRGFAPDSELMASIMEIAEHIFHRVCVAEQQEKVLIEKAKRLRDSTPPRT